MSRPTKAIVSMRQAQARLRQADDALTYGNWQSALTFLDQAQQRCRDARNAIDDYWQNTGSEEA